MRGRGFCGSSAQRNTEPATPIVLVVAGLSSSAPFTTTTQRTFPRAPPFTSRVASMSCKKKDMGEEFKTYDLVDVNRGLWYGVPIIPSGVNRSTKGALPDMTSNYIGFYKMHEDTFQIILTQKPRTQRQKRNNK